jgi:hypothetical protein
VKAKQKRPKTARQVTAELSRATTQIAYLKKVADIWKQRYLQLKAK